MIKETKGVVKNISNYLRKKRFFFFKKKKKDNFGKWKKRDTEL